MLWPWVVVWVGVYGIPPQEYEALMDFINSTSNPSLLTGWGSGDPCLVGWRGITCDNNRITELALPDLGHLGGSIPDSFGNLSALNLLDLANDTISGTLPNTIGNLKALTHLNLYYNEISGTLPESLYTIYTLSFFRVSTNSFTGTISESIGNLINVTRLGFSWNSFTNLPNSIVNLVNLTYIDMQNNEVISGTIPDGIGNLKSLEYLDLNTNNISGTIPSSISSLTSLTYLDLSSNSLCGGCFSLSFSDNCYLTGWEFNCSCSPSICNTSCTSSLNCPPSPTISSPVPSPTISSPIPSPTISSSTPSPSPNPNTQDYNFCSQNSQVGICVTGSSVIDNSILNAVPFISANINGPIHVPQIVIIHSSVLVLGSIETFNNLWINGNLTIQGNLYTNSNSPEISLWSSSKITIHGAADLSTCLIYLTLNNPLSEGEYTLITSESISSNIIPARLIIQNNTQGLCIHQDQSKRSSLTLVVLNCVSPSYTGIIVGVIIGFILLVLLFGIAWCYYSKLKTKRSLNKLSVKDSDKGLES